MSRNGEAHDAFYGARDHGGQESHAHPLMDNLAKTFTERAISEGTAKDIARNREIAGRDVENAGGFGFKKGAWDPQTGHLNKRFDLYRPGGEEPQW